MLKKIISVFLVLVFCIPFCGCSNNGMKIYGADGTLLATVSDYTTGQFITDDNDLSAYLEIVYQEAVDILTASEKIDAAEAKKQLVNKSHAIYTNFDNSVYTSIKNAYQNEKYAGLDLGCAVTNNTGKLLAAYCGGTEGENFATKRTPPYSSLKPLSAYAPAIDSRITMWSTNYMDSPVKKVVSTDGTQVDWPSNADGIYENRNIDVKTAIKFSLNTIAVRCLMDYGVTRSVEFLKDSFDFPLEAEEQIIEVYGDEEVLGNLGMGYLRDGVSPVNMAGYYQIFANGGFYTAPKTISDIKNASGKSVYKFTYEPKQVIDNSTSVVMNKLLQEVIRPEATGAMAACEGIEIGGKTGTGDLGNWFVGFSPEYSCAVWHGTQLTQNNAPEIFADIINGIPNKKLNKFVVTTDVKLAVYCCESGMLKGENCDNIATGYFTADSLETVCDLH